LGRSAARSFDHSAILEKAVLSDHPPAGVAEVEEV
jgi:hypothetical protein